MATTPHVDGLRRPSLETDYSRQSVVDVVRLARLAKRAFTVDGKTPHGEPAAPPPVIDPAQLLQMRRSALTKSKKELRFFTSRAALDVCKDLEVDPNVGLTTAEAAERLKDHGRNELQKEEKEGILRMIFDQFTDLLVIMLIVSAMVSLLLGEREAAIAIVVIVLANAVLGVVQESKAEAALEALETLSSPTTTVLRDAIHQEIESALVVPGDIVILDLGKSITADVRLIDTQAFYCGEMALTGESEPVKKDANFLYPPVDPSNPDTPRGPKTPRGGPHKKEETLTEKNMAYMGCTVLDGRGKGVAVKTGMATKMGEIAHLLKGADKGMSPLQAKLSALGEKLGMASLAISAVVFVVGVITGHGADPASVQPVWLQMLLVAVSLTVAAVPEGLPACVTITLAIGMRQMVKKNALIRNLRSVETLGSASVICTDKTGTLTTGVMTAVRIWFSGVVFKITGQSYEPIGEITPLDAGVTADPSNAHLRPLFHGMLCSNARLQRNAESKAWECVGNSSERPLVVAAAKAGLNGSEVENTFLRLHENPFSSQRKSMSVVHLLPSNAKPALLAQFLGEESARSIAESSVDRFLVVAKGAPLSVVEMSTHSLSADGTVVPMTPAIRSSIEAAIDDFSNQAFRVLAIAYRVSDELPEDRSHESLEHDMVFAGLVGSIDPEREEVAPSIKKAAAAGIRTVMITGDYVKTAKAIAEKIGILPAGSPDAKAVDCDVVRELGGELDAIIERLKDPKLSPEEKKQLKTLEDETHAKLDEITAFADVYARAKPADKITIVRSLQRQGHVCSMTGDGVNDAPALKQANIGVAMGITGTDVAKAASDMVLTDDNFCSIVEAIEQGRNIYANIQKFVFFLLSTNVSEVFVIFIPVLLGMPAPMVPIQLLWMNLATDGMPAIALAMEACEPGLMDEGPRPASESIIEKVMIVGIVIQTVVLTGLGIWLYMLGLKWEVGSWNADHIVVENGRMSELFFAKGVAKARTMVIMFYCFAELWRAYSSRSMRVSVFTMGLWKNKVMQRAVGASVVGTIIMATVPRAMSIFDTEYLSFREYFVVAVLSIVPFLVDEATKAVYRATGFGRRPTVFERSAVPVETVIGKEKVNEEGEIIDPNAPADAESKKTN